MVTRRNQEELSFTAEEALLSTQQNPCCLLKVCMAVTPPCPRVGFPAKYSPCRSHACSPRADRQPLLWSSAQPLSHSCQLRQIHSAHPGHWEGGLSQGELQGGSCRKQGDGVWEGNVTIIHSTPSAPSVLGCVLQTRLQQTNQRKPWSLMKATSKMGTRRPSQQHTALHFLWDNQVSQETELGFQQSILLRTHTQ